jgi:hypothetical protein
VNKETGRLTHPDFIFEANSFTLLLAHLLNIQLAVNFKSKPEYIIIRAIWPEDKMLFCISSHTIFGHELGPILYSWQSQVILCEPTVDSTGTIQSGGWRSSTEFHKIC